VAKEILWGRMIRAKATTQDVVIAAREFMNREEGMPVQRSIIETNPLETLSNEQLAIAADAIRRTIGGIVDGDRGDLDPTAIGKLPGII
jgi:hypothetical protein